jgi:TonB-linked SusC/RagA family outer membrane protein
MQKSHAYARRLLLMWHSSASRLRFSLRYNLVSIMKLTFYWCAIVLVTSQTLFAAATAAQSIKETAISMELKSSSLKTALKKLENASGFSLAYPSEKVGQYRSVTLNREMRSVHQTLKELLADTDLDFRQINRSIILFEKVKEGAHLVNTSENAVQYVLQGRVIAAENGEVLPGATVLVKNEENGTTTNKNGHFSISVAGNRANLVVSFIGYRSVDTLVTLPLQSELVIRLNRDITVLREVVVSTGYFETTRAMSTGNISKVTAETIERQPLGNPLAALQGRMAGVFINNTSGIPGAAVNVQIRGTNTIESGRNPLYLIDGVPVTNTALNRFPAAQGPVAFGGGMNPLSAINPADIESIEVLKDADATAIYGSRGANGVILITTKKGKAGKTKVELDFYTGFSKATRTLNVLSTSEYLDLRRAAFAADGITPNSTNAPDLVDWNPNQHTDWQKELMGNKAPVHNAQLNISGGNENTRFLFGTSFRNEGATLIGDNFDKRGSAHLNLQHTSPNKKFNLNTTLTYGVDHLKTTGFNPFSYLLTSPNLQMYDSTGTKPFWFSTSTNPSSYKFVDVQTKTDNFIGNTTLRYQLLNGLEAKADIGYTRMNVRQTQKIFSNNVNPFSSSSYTNESYLASTQMGTISVEPQLNYTVRMNRSLFSALLVSTYQHTTTTLDYFTGRNFPSDALMGSFAAAAVIADKGSNREEYKYQSVFGRLSYTRDGKYILNGTVRRDGSSRFGEGNRFGNFWAVGAGWIFSNEAFIAQLLPVMTFGKLRASYGTTGNDQIGNYRYLETYSATGISPYMGVTGIVPSRVANPNYSWEVNKKMEFGLETVFLKNRLGVNVSWYRNRSSNQLVSYPLPSQSGFSSYQYNLPALVENKGWEFEITSQNITHGALKWTTSFNLTTLKNTLLEFPGLASTTYANKFEIGQSVNVFRVYKFKGINPDNGLAMVEDKNGDGVFNAGNDYFSIGSDDPRFYGGLGNNFKFKGLELDIFFQFSRKPVDYGYLWSYYTPVGGRENVKRELAQDYWTTPGQIATRPRLTNSTSTEAGRNYTGQYAYSDAAFSDASYIRLKNLSLSYNLPAKWSNTLRMENIKFYVQGQNLLTITNYDGLDPETPRLTPPSKTFIAGIRLTL